MARLTTPNDTPENEVLNFKQNEEENLKDTWYILDTIVGGNFLGSHTIDSYGAIMNLVGSPPLMVNGTTLTLEHVMQRLDAIENKIATIELIEDLDIKIHNQITQYRSKVGMVLKNLREKEPIVNDSSRIGKLEDLITNLGSAFAVVHNTPNLTLKKTVKSVFVPKASAE
ncbi:Far1 [Hordeum vulgare]|nr:Far1 [Hordeum vulgare]